MRKCRVFFLCLLLSGCVSITTLPDQTFSPATKTGLLTSSLLNKRIDSVRAGMTYSEAAADGAVSEDELTPLVFEKDVLVGNGWNFLNQLRNNPGPGRYRDI